jgi:hypothetical protein
MNTKDIALMQAKIGATPDGFWGPKSIAACQAYLRSLMPKKNPWPKTDQASLTKFYGSAGDESKLVNLNVEGLGLKYDGMPVKTVRCHGKVAESLKRVFAEIAAGPNKDVLGKYAGCFNNRAMRGGSLPSLHARGAAVDLDPDDNGNHSAWPTRATMPLEVMKAFAREGWLSAGAFWSRDGMHMQATQ